MDGRTSLHYFNISPEGIKYFIEHGADINALDNRGWTPLRAQFSFRDKNAVKILKEHGAKQVKTDEEYDEEFPEINAYGSENSYGEAESDELE